MPGVQVEAGEVPMATITLPEFAAGSYLVLATRRGIIKKTTAGAVRARSLHRIRAITLDEKDELAWVDVSSGEDDVIIATAQGMIARFRESEVRAMGRDAAA
jgi:DNA gyrase subunit A